MKLVLKKSVRRAARLPHRSETWVLLEKLLENEPPADLPEGMSVAELTMEELESRGFFKALHFPEDLEARFRTGDFCLGVLQDDELAHVSWMARGRLPLDPGIPAFNAPDSVGVYDTHTLPPFRRRGCQTIALREIFRRAVDEGFSSAVTVIRPSNRPSLGAFGKAGFAPIGMLVYRRVLWHRRLRVQPLDDPSSEAA